MMSVALFERELLRRLRNQSGVTLITFIILTITLALIGATLIEFASDVHLSSDLVTDQIKAMYIAEGGIHYAIQYLRIRAGSERLKDDKIGPIALGDGSFTVAFNFAESLIVSEAEVHGVHKKVQMQYNVL